MSRDEVESLDPASDGPGRARLRVWLDMGVPEFRELIGRLNPSTRHTHGRVLLSTVLLLGWRELQRTEGALVDGLTLDATVDRVRRRRRLSTRAALKRRHRDATQTNMTKIVASDEIISHNTAQAPEAPAEVIANVRMPSDVTSRLQMILLGGCNG